MKYNEQGNPEKIDKAEKYLSHFPSETGTSSQNSIREKALENALGIRKFEIELYWKRAAYFWAFIALAFAGYFEILKEGNKFPAMKDLLLLLCTLLGLFLSLCWFFVNKASKYWQENWEKHVDLLEDDVMGPLYKTILNPQTDDFKPFFHPTRAFSFSISKINQLLSFAIVMVWFFLFCENVIRAFDCNQCIIWPILIAVGIFIAMIAILGQCKSTNTTRKDFSVVRNKIIE